MTQNKTQPTDQPPAEFLNAIEHPKTRADAFQLLEILEEQTNLPARMWGTSMIGVGNYHYRYASGHEGDMFLAGFSPRKRQFALYLTIPEPQRAQFLTRLGKHRAAVSCIYINKLEDIDTDILKEMIDASVQYLQQTFPPQS